MKINYVIATCSGMCKRKFKYSLVEKFSKKHSNILKHNNHEYTLFIFP